MAVLFVNGGVEICNGTGLWWEGGRCYCPNSPYHTHAQGAWDSTTPFWERQKASDIPKRKSSGCNQGQRRIAVYNYRSVDWFKSSWQGELTQNPRHVRWARRRRKERHTQ